MCKECEHNYFLASITDEHLKSLGYGGVWECFKIGSLVCSKCGETKQVELDVYRKRTISQW